MRDVLCGAHGGEVNADQALAIGRRVIGRSTSVRPCTEGASLSVTTR
jgi:hypothetical protein